MSKEYIRSVRVARLLGVEPWQIRLVFCRFVEQGQLLPSAEDFFSALMQHVPRKPEVAA